MAGLGYKDFTAGAVLTAAQVDGYLMEQSVMNFAGTAERGSALASVLSAGQMAHVGGGTVTVYDGSAWQQVYPASAGLTFVAGTAVSAVSSVSVNNCFTSTYENYLIILRLSCTDNATIRIRLRASGSDNSTSNYVLGRYYVGAGASQAAGSHNNVTADYWSSLYPGQNTQGVAVINLAGPQAAIDTTGNMICGGEFLDIYGYRFKATTQFDGFTFYTASAGTLTGNVRVYGYKN